jgi:hypothetical protein
VNVHVGQTEADRAQTGPQLVQELKEATAAGEKVSISGGVIEEWKWCNSVGNALSTHTISYCLMHL